MSVITAPVRGCVRGVASGVVVSAGGTPFTPTLDYNYVSTMALGGLETFTRASTGWYFNSAGTLTSAATDAARFDYDPTTARTNLILRSSNQDNAGVWTAGQVSVTADTVTDPLGTTTADTLTENSGSTSRGTLQGVAIDTHVTQTFSVYAKAGSRSWLRLMLNTGADSIIGWFNLATGVVGSTQVEGTGASPVVAITDAGSGWYRCALTGIPASADSGTIQAFIRMATADSEFSYQGNGTGTLHLWGAQLETGSSATAYIATAGSAVTVCTARGLLLEGARTNLFLNSAVGVTQSCTVAAAANTLSFWGTGTITLTGVSTAGPLVGTAANARVSLSFTPTAGSLTLTVSGSCTNVQLELGAYATSPIVTVGSTVTRAADVCTIATSAIPSFNAAQGAVLADLVTLDTTTSLNAGGWLLSDGTTNNRVSLRARNSGNAQALVVTGGVTQISLREAGTLTPNVATRCAVAWATNSVAFARDGATPLTTGTTTVPTGLTEFRLGNSNPTGTEPLNGWLRRIAYAPTRADNTALQTLTT